MFGFEEHEADELGSEGRFHAREEKFVDKQVPLPRWQHRFWWLVHNCVAHPALGVYPTEKTFQFHDWTSRKLNAAE